VGKVKRRRAGRGEQGKKEYIPEGKRDWRGGGNIWR